MLVPDDAASRRLILVQLGQTTNADFVFLVDSLWAQNAYAAGTHPRLPYLYTFRDAVKARITMLAETAIDWTGPGGPGEKASQSVSNLRALIAAEGPIETEIAGIFAQLAATAGTATGELTKQNPADSGATFPDPNSRAYRGDPLVRVG